MEVFGTIVIDSEVESRKQLCRLLSREPDIKVIGAFGDAPPALKALAQHRPELIFLETHLPSMSGFEVLRRLQEPLPLVVFVTEDRRRALDAFSVNAIDYLLKPISAERVRKTLSRVRAHPSVVRSDPLGQQLVEAMHRLAKRRDRQPRKRPESTYLQRVAVRRGDRVVFLETSEIDWVEAAGNYVCLHLQGRRHLLRMTLAEMERRLDPRRFVRVHRSRIVNAERVRELQPLGSGDCRLVLTDGTVLVSSRTYGKERRRLLASPS